MKKVSSISSNRELTKHLSDMGMKQEDFAELIGYSTHAFKKWKKGKIPKWLPFVIAYLESIKENEKLAQELNLSLCK